MFPFTVPPGHQPETLAVTYSLSLSKYYVTGVAIKTVPLLPLSSCSLLSKPHFSIDHSFCVFVFTCMCARVCISVYFLDSLLLVERSPSRQTPPVSASLELKL